MPGQFTVTIDNLATGGQLSCENNIQVSYTQPDNVATSSVALTTDAAGATITPASHNATATSGTVMFRVDSTPGTSLTGKTVTATISNGGSVQASDPKTNISVQCPPTGPGSG
jgi:hypothetical protein